MKRNTTITEVIFRKFTGGEVIAIFPCEPCSHRLDLCISYQCTGQHGGASVWLSRWTKLARPKEYRELAQELRRIGYRLRIITRIPRNAWSVRKSKLPTK